MLEIAIEAARAAGAELLTRFDRPHTGVGTKSSATDMVTDADRAAEAIIVDIIGSARPDDTLFGEESGERAGTSGRRWVIDPLDGTTNYLFGVPQWAVSIACEDADGVAIGVVFDPLRDELFAGARGEGATLNGSPVAVSPATDLSKALVVTGFSYLPGERAAAAAILPALITRVRDVRRLGAAALDLAWVAAGRLDGYYETPISHHDVVAGTLLVLEAGGRVEPLPSVGPTGAGVVAAGPGLFAHLRDLVVELLGQG